MTRPAALPFVAGVDAGGTRTRARVATLDGCFFASGESGPGNPGDADPDAIARHLREALAIAIKASGFEGRAPAALHLAYAGAGSEAGRDTVLSAARRLRLPASTGVTVGTDLAAARTGAFNGGPGIVVVAGTGSGALGVDGAGRECRAGGHGSFLDDPGGATDLGRRAAAAVMRASDGRGPATGLAPGILALLGLPDPAGLPRMLGPSGEARRRTAALAPLVAAAAAGGDPVARSILREAAAALAACPAAVARRLRWEDPPVAAAGGLVDGCPGYRGVLAEAILEAIPGARFQLAATPPDCGAAILALQTLRTR